MAKKSASTIQAFEISDRVALQANERRSRRRLARRGPLVRPLRIYTLDPSVSDRLGGTATVQVPYEELGAGPVGGLFEIRCDGAPAPLKVEPLNLDDPLLLMSSGLAPSPANGQFHLQMVYAVCSLTYTAFRRALGREVRWAIPRPESGPMRLIVRPFGFRGRNAGYNRETGDLSFGYFKAGKEPAGFTIQKGLICTSLSHDIIAHETTHALLDGLRASFSVPTNVDVPAFHEGFADLVALFLHFTYTEVVEQAIRGAGGQTDTANRFSLLTDLAREFGYTRSAPGRERALRSGIDVDGLAAFDSDILPSKKGGPDCYDPTIDPHLLGSVLVSAVFEAFMTIVRRKTERYFRLAGVDPLLLGRAPLSDSLVKVVAQEASDVATQFLAMCIRAIDYCPPCDMEFGEYLRALITADGDLERADKWGFREALMRSFRRRRIFPDHVQFMTEESVRWQPPDGDLRIRGLAFNRLKFEGDPGQPAGKRELLRQARVLGQFVTDPKHAKAFHLVAPAGKLPKGVTQASPAVVQSVRVARRAAPDGRVLFDLVGEVTQTCTVQQGNDIFELTGGATVVVDPQGDVRYAIYKRFGSDNRQARQHAAMKGPLKKYWEKTGRRYKLLGGMLRRLHEGGRGY
jgi:hypothetical protein